MKQVIETLSDKIHTELTELFCKGLEGWSWEDWITADENKKVALAEYAWARSLCPVSYSQVLEIFKDWSSTVNRDLFKEGNDE